METASKRTHHENNFRHTHSTCGGYRGERGGTRAGYKGEEGGGDTAHDPRPASGSNTKPYARPCARCYFNTTRVTEHELNRNLGRPEPQTLRPALQLTPSPGNIAKIEIKRKVNQIELLIHAARPKVISSNFEENENKRWGSPRVDAPGNATLRGSLTFRVQQPQRRAASKTARPPRFVQL